MLHFLLKDCLPASGTICGSPGAPACLYSTAPILRIDETNKTATLDFHYTAPYFSFFGGNAEVLANNDVDFNESARTPPTGSDVFEVTQQPIPQVVWQMGITGNLAYRGMRLPSLYPGVQW